MKIICIGRNYIEHAKELNSPLPENPVFFLKPETALLKNNRPFHMPGFTRELHYEVELVMIIHKKGRNIPEEEAGNYYKGITVGIDFTARDLQQKCKEKGLPWEIAKGFDHSAPISNYYIPAKELVDPQNIRFHLLLNGNKVQDGNSADMIFPFSKVIAYVSQFITLEPGDLVYTGTPAGVGAVKPGDKLEAFLEGEKMLTCSIK
jgi:2-keto-4-pentenoate hydratase/2-oxohepta-3-ene-1,7-dioic acid hydratase in catechol pathway